MYFFLLENKASKFFKNLKKNKNQTSCPARESMPPTVPSTGATQVLPGGQSYPLLTVSMALNYSLPKPYRTGGTAVPVPEAQ